MHVSLLGMLATIVAIMAPIAAFIGVAFNAMSMYSKTTTGSNRYQPRANTSLAIGSSLFLSPWIFRFTARMSTIRNRP